MTLILRSEQWDLIRAHAERTYPDECCGLLLGTREPEGDRRWVHEVWPQTNEWTMAVNPFVEPEAASTPVSKRSRYWIDPKDLMAAQRTGRDRGWIILGVYHSHPDHPAVPSERDRQLAWPEYSYPIVSVMNGHAVEVKSWRLNEAGQYQPEAITADTALESS